MPVAQITTVFDPPVPGDSGTVFDNKAFDTVGKWNPWGVEANLVATYVNDRALDALAAALAGSLSELDFVGAGGYFITVAPTEDGVIFSEVTTYDPLLQADWNAGVSTSEAPISPAKLAGAIDAQAGPDARYEDSTVQTLNSGPFLYSFTASQTPRDGLAYLVCTSAINGHEVGDKVILDNWTDDENNRSLNVIIRGNTVRILIGAGSLRIHRQDTGANFQPTSANFDLYIRAIY